MTDSPCEQPSSVVGALLRLLFVFEGLKLVERQNPLAVAARHENTAEHSWSVALAVLVFKSLAVEDLDLGHAVELALAHDLPEAFVGDTFVYGNDADSRFSREASAMAEFLSETDTPDESGQLVALWREYESRSTPEARYVFALDVLLPVFMNFSNLENSSWIRHGVSADEVRARIRAVQDWIPQLALHAFAAVDAGVSAGALRGPSG
jgi:putative hydrolase of HD superfamily